jgi:superfamily II DNA or RNA helicase
MKLLDAIRKAVPADTWSAAVSVARSDGVRIDAAAPDEIRASVRVPGRALPFEVHLWPAEPDWDCDCPSRQRACLHVAAAAIAARTQAESQEETQAESQEETHEEMQEASRDAARGPIAPGSPSPRAASRTWIRVCLTRVGRGLHLELQLVRTGPDGERAERLHSAIASSGAWAKAGDLEVEAAIAASGSPVFAAGSLPSELWPRVLAGLEDGSDVRLDDRPVSASHLPVSLVLRIDDEGQGFLARLVTDPRIDESFEAGVVRCGNTLHPTTARARPGARPSSLDESQTRVLERGLHYAPDEVGRLVGELIPQVKRYFPLDLRTHRLPEGEALRPALRLSLGRNPEDDSLSVEALLVYGDPPVARIDDGRLVLLPIAGRSTVPVRDREAERRANDAAGRLLGVMPGHRRILPVPEALDFVTRVLPRFRGTVDGSHLALAYHLRDRPLRPRLDVAPGRPGRFRVQVDADGASAEALLGAWQRGSELVPLLDGGFARLPPGWLDENGWRLAEILSARDADGEVPANTAPTLAEFVHDSGDVPLPALEQLRSKLQDFRRIPEVAPPEGLRGTLRTYQARGLDWLAFLRDADLGGVLADDMGLGKTLQALAAMAQVPGPHLVVAPTSVLRNWVQESNRFLPALRVCLFHGPDRVLDVGADLVVTSYALLRRDVDALAAVAWSYAVLDEAQAIKNPDSQVAAAARRLDARHRLALSGTPVENRLEELWSLFAFVLPGLLGRRSAFSDRIAESLGGPSPARPSEASATSSTFSVLPPAEAGRDRALALDWLKRRVHPFILRRLKRDVAPELPPRTDVVWRCELGEGQRGLYDAIRAAALADVRDASGAFRPLGVLEALLRLRQAACHPALLPGDHAALGSGKVDQLMEALPTLAEEGHRALVFSQWTSFFDLLEPILRGAGIAFCRLDGSTRDRAAVVDRFQSPDGPPVFLVSLKAGGTGLNLTAADYVFHLDPWWNPAVEDQAVDRAHRIGQSRPVISVRLVAADTVEERILALQEAKRALVRAAITDEAGFAANISREELLSLLD